MTPNPMQPGGPGAEKPSYALPIIAFIVSLIGVCIFPLAAVGFVLGLVAVLRIGKEPHLPGKGLAITAMVLPALVVPIGIMAAIAIPNFIRFQARSKQSECKSNLKAVYTAQRSYLAEHEAFTTDLGALGFSPEPRRRYSYFVGEDSVVPADFPGAADADTHQLELTKAGVTVGVEGQCPDCTFTAACVGNVDNDGTFDVWAISSADQTDADGMPVMPGQPYNVVNDVKD